MRAGGKRGTLRSAVGLGFSMLLALLSPAVSQAMERVRAELGKASAWVGEPVPLIITLFSPGPFSGTASFELPELPSSVFVRAGNPQVGSERIGGETYFTQRHEFAVYTQRAGEILIATFRVRFAGKKTFTSAAEPVEGFTPELRFQSTRPPGTEHLGPVVAAKKMEASQTWQPGTNGTARAGDVIVRTISRRAVGTTAMLLPPIQIETPEGVRHYASAPLVQDFSERGAALAERSETIKYQFERAGTFPLPDITVLWWDSDAAELKRVTLPGKVVDVLPASPVAESLAESPSPRWPLVGLILLICLAAWLLRPSAMRLLTAQRARRNDPASLAARLLLAACRNNAAHEAYAAGLQWQRAVGWAGLGLDQRLPPATAAGFAQAWSQLSAQVYATESEGPPWDGAYLARIFADVRRNLGQASRARLVDSGLPPLNPACSPRRGNDRKTLHPV